MKKSIIFFVLILFLSFHAAAVSAQTQRDWWYTLERGKLMFRQGDYGNALLAFEDARRQRRVMYERLEGASSICFP